jgi:hypothetical protein
MIDKALMPGSKTPRPPGCQIHSWFGCQRRTSSFHCTFTAVISCPASHARAGSTPGAQRECHDANRLQLFCRASSTSTAISETLAPGGFSSITCLPAVSAAFAWAKRTCGGAHKDTACRVGSTASIASMVR